MIDPIEELGTQGILPTASDLLALASRPAPIIAHRKWNTARETVLALVNAGPGMIVVLGPPGTGKTALLRDLATTLGGGNRAACLLDFGDSPQEIGPAEIVLVDEADRLGATRLDELRARGNLAIVLAVLPASGERFRRDPDVTVIRLAPLSPDEARAFVGERLAQLGCPNECLTVAAWERLIAYGHGVPRLLLTLLGLALFLASSEHAERVSGDHVTQALNAQNGSEEPSPAEPTRAEAEPVQLVLAEVPVEGEETVSETALTWIGETSPRWRTRAAVAALMMAYSIVVVGLLAWGHLQWVGRAASGSDAPGVVRTTLAADEGSGQETGSSPPVSASPVSVASTDTRPLQSQAVAPAQLATVAVATQPFGEQVSPPAPAVDLPHRCGDEDWTWSACRPHPRRVMWHRVQHCAIAVGNLCLGRSYSYIQEVR